MSTAAKLQEIVDALSVQTDGVYQYLQVETGEIVMVSDEEVMAAKNEADLAQYADWQQEIIKLAQQIRDQPDNFIELPSKYDIHEYEIMERFCLSVEDEAISNDLYQAIKGRGAFRRFKDSIHRYELAEAWYKYRDEALAEIAKKWCELHEISYR